MHPVGMQIEDRAPGRRLRSCVWLLGERQAGKTATRAPGRVARRAVPVALTKEKRRREEGLFPAAARQTRLELAVFSIM
ncbi:MAG: hypothetical protein COA37_02035 [Hoeflea sp.]|nr:MAG: hypothetical protein COA37_02035 [Hoeflea sp.]